MDFKRSNKQQQIVADYLTKTAMTDLELASAIEKCTKSFEDMWSYILTQAQKQAENNCAMIEDSEVFGWATHYILENGVACETTYNVQPAPKKEETPKQKAKPKQEKPKMTQYSLFDLAEIEDEE